MQKNPQNYTTRCFRMGQDQLDILERVRLYLVAHPERVASRHGGRSGTGRADALRYALHLAARQLALEQSQDGAAAQSA